MRPSIWTGTYSSIEEWRAADFDRQELARVYAAIEDGMLHPLIHVTITAWCSACNAPRPMLVTWHLARIDADGSLSPSRTETASCEGCRLSSRMRAVVDFIRTNGIGGRALIGEQVTPSTAVFARLFDEIVASEYLGANVKPGSIHKRDRIKVRHEDFTQLSLRDASVDVVVTQDVFEHIPDFGRAFAECRRVLTDGGKLVFTVPFFSEQASTEVIASVRPDGTIDHVGLPEIHGNPLGGGSLCFQHFGWDILEHLRSAGFSRAVAHTYRGVWQGHLHNLGFVFEATA